MVEIRIITVDDVEAYRVNRLEAVTQNPDAFGSSAEDEQNRTLEETKQRINPDNPAGSFVMGAFADGQLAGTVGLVLNTRPKRRHYAVMSGVHVSLAYRRQGLARQLTQATLDRARDIPHLEFVQLNVATHNTGALALYESFGFTRFGTQPGSIKLGERYIDEHLMVLALRA